MRNIPIIFPVALVMIVVATFFTGAYAVSEAALNGDSAVAERALASSAGVEAPIGARHPDAGLDWYENAAIFVCPLH